MAKKLSKTNAARLLDHAKVEYKLVEYKVDEQDLSAVHVANQLGEDVAQVFKTLVLVGDRNGFFVAIIPADKEVDLKKAAKESGNKSAEMLAMKELLPTTGYIRGACSPIGMKKPLATYIHSTSLDFDSIFVSAGIRGMQIELSPRDVITLSKAKVCSLIKE